MTTQKWRAMSAEQRSVWIAEKLDDKFKLCPIHHQHECCGRGRIPDYERDLNACAEMVSTLPERNRVLYLHFLDCIATGVRGMIALVEDWSISEIYAITEATAPQRCEAFALAVEPETGE